MAQRGQKEQQPRENTVKTNKNTNWQTTKATANQKAGDRVKV